jgi:hypothetical protein
MDLNNLENKFFFHLDKFSKTCEGTNEKEMFDAFKETANVWKELKKYNLTDKLRKDHPNATDIFDNLDEFNKEVITS